MKQRAWGVIIAAVAIGIFYGQRSCAKEPPLTLPETAGAWKLSAPPNCVKPVPAEWKSWRGSEGAARACRGDYTGLPPVTFTIYDMPNEFASAFDAAQKWQPQPGKMAFFKGRYFGVAESPAADRPTLERFVLDVEATLPAASEWHR